MISLTGGFNQQYMGAEIKVAKEKFGRDTLVLSEALQLRQEYRSNFVENLDALTEALKLNFHTQVKPGEDMDEYIDAISYAEFRENIDDLTDALILDDLSECFFNDSLDPFTDTFEQSDQVHGHLTIPNLLENGDFEDSDAHWTLDDFTVEVSGDAHFTAVGIPILGTLTQNNIFKPNTHYKLTFTISESVDANEIIIFRIYDPIDLLLDILVVEGAWPGDGTHTYSFTTPSALLGTSFQLMVEAPITVTPSFTIDDIILEEIGHVLASLPDIEKTDTLECVDGEVRFLNAFEKDIADFTDDVNNFDELVETNLAEA